MSAASLPLLTDEEVIKYARGAITGEYMVADLSNDPDWQASCALLLSGMKDNIAPNASTTWLVPLDRHMKGFWINGRVPALTHTAVILPIESLQAFWDKYVEFHNALYPDNQIDGAKPITPEEAQP